MVRMLTSPVQAGDEHIRIGGNHRTRSIGPRDGRSHFRGCSTDTRSHAIQTFASDGFSPPSGLKQIIRPQRQRQVVTSWRLPVSVDRRRVTIGSDQRTAVRAKTHCARNRLRIPGTSSRGRSIKQPREIGETAPVFHRCDVEIEGTSGSGGSNRYGESSGNPDQRTRLQRQRYIAWPEGSRRMETAVDTEASLRLNTNWSRTRFRESIHWRESSA